jgi:non-specific protein-tyrosine kinase
MNDFVELRRVITTIAKWWWLLILATVAAAAIGYAISNRQPPVYEATTTVMVGQFIQATEVNRDYLLTSQVLIQTYADMAQRQPVLQSAVEALDLDESWSELRGRVEVSQREETQQLAISVEADSPEEARVTADEVARQLILLSPTATQDREKGGNQQLAQERVESLRTKIEAGQQRLQVLEETMSQALSAWQVKELQSEINTLQNLVDKWEDDYTNLLISIEGKTSPNSLTIVEPAHADSSPIRPQPQTSAMVGGAVGLALALGFIFLLEIIDNSVKSADELGQSLGLTVLGSVSRIKGKLYQNKLISFKDLFSPVVEDYRVIRSNIEFMTLDQPIKSIVITSSDEGEGKSITVANLGIIMAQAGLRTLIVDADLRRPVQHQLFQVSNTSGLAEFLQGKGLKLDSPPQNTTIENLQLLTSGVLPSNPAELLGSQRLRLLLSMLNEAADVIIFDSPPALLFTDAVVLANRADGVILVIEAGQTSSDVALKTISKLKQANANLMGGVINRVPLKTKNNYFSYYKSVASQQQSISQLTYLDLANWRRWLTFSVREITNLTIVGVIFAVVTAIIMLPIVASSSSSASSSQTDDAPSVAEPVAFTQVLTPTPAPTSLPIIPADTLASLPNTAGSDSNAALISTPASTPGSWATISNQSGTLMTDPPALFNPETTESTVIEASTAKLTLTPKPTAKPTNTASPTQSATPVLNPSRPIEAPESIAQKNGVSPDPSLTIDEIENLTTLQIGERWKVPADTDEIRRRSTATAPSAVSASSPVVDEGGPAQPTIAPSGSTAPDSVTPVAPLENVVGAFTLLAPSPQDYDFPSYGPTDFEWSWSGAIPPDHGFEVRVWREGEPQMGIHDAVGDNREGRIEQIAPHHYRLSINIKDVLGPSGLSPRPSGEYLWTVGLVKVQPAYANLGEPYWAEPTRFRFEAPGAGGGSSDKGGGSKSNGGGGGVIN